MSIDQDTTTPAPPKIVGKIQTDLFCPHCHYNLFGLNVLRDERLEIPVVRCPECGKFQPIGVAIIRPAWFARVAIAVIILWAAFIGGFVFLGGLGFFGSDVAVGEVFLRRDYDRSYSSYMLELRYPDVTFEYHAFRIGLWVCTLFLAWIWAGAMTVFLWQRKRNWFLLLLIVPLLSAGAAWIYYAEMRGHMQSWVVNWVASHVAVHVIIQLAGIPLGILTGRAITRGIARAILTPRMLRHLLFLWIADNKTPPKFNP
jgi:hypothetical protein